MTHHLQSSSVQEKARVGRIENPGIKHQVTLVEIQFYLAKWVAVSPRGKLIGVWIIVPCGDIHWRIAAARSRNQTRACRRIIATALAHLRIIAAVHEALRIIAAVHEDLRIIPAVHEDLGITAAAHSGLRIIAAALDHPKQK